MTIRYQNSFRDVIAFCFYHYPRAPVTIGSYGILFAVLSFIIFQALPKDGSVVTKIVLFAVMEVIAFSVLAAVLALSVVLSMVSRRNRTFLTEHTIVLGEQIFTEETVYNKTEQKWTSVQKLARTRRYIFIYLAQHMAHVVPRRAFRDDAEWDAFYDYCSQRTQATRLRSAAT
jgi:hypothetical protein